MPLVDLSQILGNFGEFVGAIVITITLVFLFVEVRANRRATLIANAHERHRQRDSYYALTAEMSSIVAKSWEHMGNRVFADGASAFGLEPQEMVRMNAAALRATSMLADWFHSDLPERDRQSMDAMILGMGVGDPVMAKWFEMWRTTVPREYHGMHEFLDYVDRLRAQSGLDASQ